MYRDKDGRIYATFEWEQGTHIPSLLAPDSNASLDLSVRIAVALIKSIVGKETNHTGDNDESYGISRYLGD